MLQRTDPDRAGELAGQAQEDVDARWHLYEQIAGVERGAGASRTPTSANPGPEEGRREPWT